MVSTTQDRSSARFVPNKPDKLVTLTPAQKQFYDVNGYLVLEGLLSPGDVARFKGHVRDLLGNPQHAHPRVRMGRYADAGTAPRPPHPENPNSFDLVMDSPLAGDDWFDNIRDPRIVDVMIDLLGPNINFHNGKCRIKPPGYVNKQGWHQDWPYERHDQPSLAAAIFYVNDTRPGVGATSVLPGSHLQGEWKHTAERGGSIPDDQVPPKFKPVELVAKAGSVAFIHVMVVHKAGNNPSDDNFTAIINEYKTAETLATDDSVTRLAFYDLPLARNARRVL